MGSGLTKFYLFLAILIFIFAVIGFYLAFKSALPDTPQNPTVNPQTSIPSRDLTTKVSIEVIKKQRLLIVRWQYLPEGTSHLNIFRSKSGTNNWALWKSVEVPGQNIISGSLEIHLNAGETTEGYSYYAQASSSSGETLWTASSTPVTYLENVPAPLTTIGPVSTSSPSESPSAIPPAATSTQNPSSSTTQSSSHQTSTDNSANQAGVTYYYSPELLLTGSTTLPVAHFTPDHIDKNIALSWQNLPQGIDLVIISRSKTQTGIFTEVLRQENPSVSYSIQLADETVYEDYYYRMETFTGSALTNTYGPILLTKLNTNY